MKRIFLVFAALFSLISYAQHTEIRVFLDSGLFSYAGDGATDSSEMEVNTNTHEGFVDNPYGTRSGLSYGLSIDARYVTEKKSIFGVSLGYQILRSTTDIEVIRGDFEVTIGGISGNVNRELANGKTHLTNYTINLFPYYGHRFNTNARPVDVLLGVDVGYILGTTNKGSVDGISEGTFTTDENFFTESFDFRPRLQISTDYKKFGVYVGYSFGLVNFKAPSEYFFEDFGEAKTRMIRFGLSYKLN